MKLAEGPAFGAMIIGAGTGYLHLQKFGNVKHAVLIAGGLALACYFILVWIAQFKNEKKNDDPED